MSKILITGGAGMIGSHLTDRLISLGHSVDVIDNLSTGYKGNINKNANFINMDICDNKLLQLYKESNKPDIICHLAAQINLRHSFDDPYNDANINIMGSLNVIKLAQECNSKFIFASTGGAIYDPRAPVPWNEFSPTKPQSPYGLSKLTVENYLRVLNIEGTILRLSNVYGPRQSPKGEAGVVSIFINDILNNKRLKIFGDGKQTRDFIYVSDVIDAFVCAIENDLLGIFNVSTESSCDIVTLAGLIIAHMQTSTSVKFLDGIPGELKNSCLSSSLLTSHGSWAPQISLNDGLLKTIKYFSDI